MRQALGVSPPLLDCLRWLPNAGIATGVQVVGAFSREDKRELLKFVTSCSRPPLLGFKHLQPPFTLHKVPLLGPWSERRGTATSVSPASLTNPSVLRLPSLLCPSSLQSVEPLT